MKRGGLDGLNFARRETRRFLSDGGVFQPEWLPLAVEIHHAFIQRHLTARGVADLLAATLFIADVESRS